MKIIRILALAKDVHIISVITVFSYTRPCPAQHHLRFDLWRETNKPLYVHVGSTNNNLYGLLLR